MRNRQLIEAEMKKNTNEIGAIDIAVARRIILEVLLDIRGLLQDWREGVK